MATAHGVTAGTDKDTFLLRTAFIVATAAMVGSWFACTWFHITTGSVRVSGFERKIAMMISSQDVTKASNAPASTLGRISGSVGR